MPEAAVAAETGMRAFPRHERSGFVLAVHHLIQVVKWTAIVAAGFALLTVVEHVWLRPSVYPVAAKPLSFARQVLGIPHFVIAVYFMLTSPRMRDTRNRLWFGGLTLATLGLCGAFWAIGGYGTAVGYIVMIHYFIWHAYRDEGFFYRLHSGPAIPKDEQAQAVKTNAWMETAAFCLLAALVAPFHVAFNKRNRPGSEEAGILSVLQGWSYPELFAVVGVPLLCMCAYAIWRLHKSHPEGLRGAVRAHWPLVCILLGLDALVVSGLLVGAWTIEFLVLMHFVGWWYFATLKIKDQPKAARKQITWRTPGQWFKRTQRGFWALHGGLAAIVFLGYVATYWILPASGVSFAGGLYRNGLAVLFNDETFYHLTVAHVTLSFVPR